MKTRYNYFLLLFSLALVSCNQQFEPNGTYEEKMVLYSILRMDTDTQYVRLYSTYNPHDNNPLTHSTDTEITDAVITVVDVSDTTKKYTFHDTLVVRADTTTPYGKYLHTYVCYKFKPLANKTYKLSAQSPSRGSLSAQATMYFQGTITLVDFVYQNLGAPKDIKLYPDTALVVKVKLGPNAPAYIVQLFVEYQQLIGSTWYLRTTEIPYFLKKGDSWDDFSALYPTLVARGYKPSGVAGEEIASFSFDSYTTILRYLVNSIGPSRIKFKGAYFVLSQTDQAVYSYYTSSNNVSDNISIRLDQIDYSNIQGGHGLFGIMTNTVSTYVTFPPNFEVP